MKRQTRFKETEIGMIPADWDVKKLDEIKSSGHRAIAMGPFGSNIRKENYKETGVPVIRGFNLKAERFLDENFVFLSEEKAEDLAGSSSFPEDIIFVAQGGVGQVGIIPKDAKYKKYILSQNLMKISCDKEKTDPFFIFYFFRSKKGQDEILSYVNPTGVPCISQPLSSLKLFRTPYPNIDEQHEIAKILLSLDEKIEINQKINLTIEKTGQALFRHWFIDFEFPNENGKPYRSSGGKMVDSELGEIPKGWTVEKLGNVVSINQKSMTGDYAEKVIQYVDISSVSEGKLQNVTTYEIAEAPSRAKRLVSHGDIIWSCVRPNRKSYLFIHRPPKNLVVSTGFVVLTPKANSRSYLYCRVTSDEFVDYLSANADGSAYPAVRPEHFAMADMLIPPGPLLDRFETVVSPVREAIAYNEEQCRTLGNIRDMLLPRLMSGRIRVGMAG